MSGARDYLVNYISTTGEMLRVVCGGEAGGAAGATGQYPIPLARWSCGSVHFGCSVAALREEVGRWPPTPANVPKPRAPRAAGLEGPRRLRAQQQLRNDALADRTAALSPCQQAKARAAAAIIMRTTTRPRIVTCVRASPTAPSQASKAAPSAQFSSLPPVRATMTRRCTPPRPCRPMSQRPSPRRG